jgi:hypothetical protein
MFGHQQEFIEMRGRFGVSQHSFDYVFAGRSQFILQIVSFDGFANKPIGKPPEFAPMGRHLAFIREDKMIAGTMG